MKKILIICIALTLIIGCTAKNDQGSGESAAPAVTIEFDAPAAIPVPARMEVSSDTDWKAKAHNKNCEVIEIVNILNPVAAFLTAAFAEYGDDFSETLQEEWADTQVQLTTALGIWTDGKERMEADKYDKKLFLDLEEAWQMLVKTGVAGLRTKSMVDAEVIKLTR